jgi:hypothetical protein
MAFKIESHYSDIHRKHIDLHVSMYNIHLEDEDNVIALLDQALAYHLEEETAKVDVVFLELSLDKISFSGTPDEEYFVLESSPNADPTQPIVEPRLVKWDEQEPFVVIQTPPKVTTCPIATEQYTYVPTTDWKYILAVIALSGLIILGINYWLF